MRRAMQRSFQERLVNVMDKEEFKKEQNHHAIDKELRDMEKSYQQKVADLVNKSEDPTISKVESTEAVESVKVEEKKDDIQSEHIPEQLMVFPTLGTENSPSIEDSIKVEDNHNVEASPTPSPDCESVAFEDADAVSIVGSVESMESDEFLTDEEYDILTCSDEDIGGN